MTTPEASVILGAAVIDDVMGLFVLAFLAASCSTIGAERIWRCTHALLLAAAALALGRPASARRADDPHRHLRHRRSLWLPTAQRNAGSIRSCGIFRKLDANEAVTSCVLALVLLYAVSAEWLGSVAGITGAYLLGYVFAGAKLKTLIERTFYAIGHGLLIPLFFVSIGLSSNFRALGGHWLLLAVYLRRRCRQQTVGLRHGGAWHGHGTGAAAFASAAA